MMKNIHEIANLFPGLIYILVKKKYICNRKKNKANEFLELRIYDEIVEKK